MFNSQTNFKTVSQLSCLLHNHQESKYGTLGADINCCHIMSIMNILLGVYRAVDTTKRSIQKEYPFLIPKPWCYRTWLALEENSWGAWFDQLRTECKVTRWWHCWGPATGSPVMWKATPMWSLAEWEWEKAIRNRHSPCRTEQLPLPSLSLSLYFTSSKNLKQQ